MFAVLVLKLERTLVPNIPGVAVSKVDFAWKNVEDLSDILTTACVKLVDLEDFRTPINTGLSAESSHQIAGQGMLILPRCS